jgi:hypothetical protein
MPAAKPKTTPKQSTAKAKTPAKKTASKKPVTKAVAKPTVKKATVSRDKSFQLSSPATSFLTFRLSIQSVYWFILCALVLALGAWVLYLSMKVQDIYDQIEINNAANSSIVAPAKHTTK